MSLSRTLAYAAIAGAAVLLWTMLIDRMTLPLSYEDVFFAGGLGFILRGFTR